MGAECYSLGRKTVDYKGKKFFLIRVKIGARRGAPRARSKARRRGKGEMGVVLRACRGGGARIGRRRKDLDEEGGRQGLAPRGLTCTALTHSSHDAHPRQSAQRPTPVKTARDISKGRSPTRLDELCGGAAFLYIYATRGIAICESGGRDASEGTLYIGTGGGAAGARGGWGAPRGAGRSPVGAPARHPAPEPPDSGAPRRDP